MPSNRPRLDLYELAYLSVANTYPTTSSDPPPDLPSDSPPDPPLDPPPTDPAPVETRAAMNEYLLTVRYDMESTAPPTRPIFRLSRSGSFDEFISRNPEGSIQLPF